MKLSRLVGLLAPVGALVACSAAPVDAPEATAKSKDLITYCPATVSCQTVGFSDVPSGLSPDPLALGCETWSTTLAYATGSGVSSAATGFFVACPPTAASELAPSCSYCLGPLENGWFWYEWQTLITEIKPCPSGCLKGPPIGEL